MRKLFRAAFYRTENKKMIRIELVIAVLLSAFIILNGYFQTNLTNAYIYKLVARFFGYSPLMGPFIAVFAAYLWGTDYEYGTLRNKLICGHTREEVYFSNLLLAFFNTFITFSKPFIFSRQIICINSTFFKLIIQTF